MTRTKNGNKLPLIEFPLSLFGWFKRPCSALPSVRYRCIFNIRIYAIHLGTGVADNCVTLAVAQSI